MFVLAQYVVIGLAVALYLSGTLVLASGYGHLSDWGGGFSEDRRFSTSSAERRSLDTTTVSVSPTYFVPASEARTTSGAGAASTLLDMGSTLPADNVAPDRDPGAVGGDTRQSLLHRPLCLN